MNSYMPPMPEEFFDLEVQDAPTSPGVPHSREAEEAVIGAVLINPEVYMDIVQFLSGEDFYIHRNRFVWESFGRLYGKKSPIDLLTVSQDLEENELLAEIGGSAYLTALLNQVPTSLNAEAYARIVQDQAVRRKMILSANKIASLAYSKGDIVSLYAQGLKSYETSLRDNAEFSTLKKELSADFDRMQRIASGERVRIVPTGFLDLDNLLDGGLRGGNLIYVAGRPGMGKTGFKLDVALAAAEAGFNVAIFSLEMSNEELTQRIAAKHGVPMSHLRTGVMTKEDWTIYTKVMASDINERIFLNDLPAIRPTQIRSKAHALHHRHGVDLIIVDYVQLMEPDDPEANNRNNELTKISRTLKILARELDIPVLCGAQLNRSLEQRTDKRPILSDLRDSGSLEQDADIVAFLYRDEVYNDSAEKGVAEVNIAKQRNGPTSTIKLIFRGELMKFENAATRIVRLNEPAPHWQDRVDMGD